MKITISKGNKKLGNIPNISLPPIWSCVKNVPCAKSCYAMKSYRMYPNVKTAWNNNLAVAKTNRESYFSQIKDYLTKHNPHFFRFHTSGDILDYNYFAHMLRIAYVFPDTQFLVFTKNYKVVNEFLNDIKKSDPCMNVPWYPANFKLYFSAWPDWIIDNPHNIPIAYMQDGTVQISESTYECPGSCLNCKHCFTNGNAVVFHKH